MKSNFNFNREQDQFPGNEHPEASDFAFLLLTGFLLSQLLNKVLNNSLTTKKINQVFGRGKLRIQLKLVHPEGFEPSTF